MEPTLAEESGARVARAPALAVGDALAPLPIDPSIRLVRLPNGLAGWIRPHDLPPGTLALGLVVRSGSLGEQEDERGLAHFLEHLAFRGTEHFPPGALTRFFDSQGTRLGRHHNASTTVEHTSFSLTLPSSSEEAVETAFSCLADFAFRMSLHPDEVEAERKVVLEEMRAVSGARSRIRERTLALLLPGSRVGARHPLGLEGVIRSVTVDRLRSFYQRSYRPERATVLVVGDIDPDRAARLLAAHFGSWPASPCAAEATDPGISPLGAARTAIITDPEATEASVSVLAVRPANRLEAVADFRSKFTTGMGLWLLNQRLAALIQQGRTACREAQASLQPLAHPWCVARLVANGPAERAAAMAADLLGEVERAHRHGFLVHEVETVKAAMRKDARQAVLGDRGRHSESIAAELEQAAVTGRPPMSREQTLALVESVLPAITAHDVSAAFDASFDLDACLLLAVLPESGGPAGEAWLPEALRSARRQERERPVARLRPTRLMARRPAPGAIAETREDAALGIVTYRLSNGVRVHVREMSARRHRISVGLTLLGGRIRETGENAGITTAAGLLFAQPACTTLGSVQIRDYLTGRALGFSCTVDDDAISLGVSGDPSDLEDAFQLVHLLLTRPHLELAALRRWQSQSEEFWEARRHSLELMLAHESLRLLTGNDTRFRPLSPERAAAITRRAAQAWFETEIAPAPLEAAIVGDLERGRATDLALCYLGSLPQRAVPDGDGESLRRLHWDRGPLESRVVVPAVVDRAAGLCGWRAAPWRLAHERHLLKMAEQILVQRLQEELRERRGWTYSAEASFSPSKAYPDAALLAVALYAAPPRIGEALATARAVVEELAEAGPSEAEMEATRKQFLHVLRVSQEDPRYWCRALADLEARGGSTTDLGGLDAEFAAAGAADVRDVLHRYVVEARRLLVICTPGAVAD